MVPALEGAEMAPVRPDTTEWELPTRTSRLSTEKPGLSTHRAGLADRPHRKDGLFDYEDMLPQLAVFVDPAVDLASAVDNRSVVPAA